MPSIPSSREALPARRTRPEMVGMGRVRRIHEYEIYRVLGTANMRRRLSLDYVLTHLCEEVADEQSLRYCPAISTGRQGR